MGGQPVPGISCILCSKPVDLQTDLCSDEHGKAVHEDCYVQHITHQPAGAAIVN
jgi:predicted nucleic acid-binding Zn ribbon protein